LFLLIAGITAGLIEGIEETEEVGIDKWLFEDSAAGAGAGAGATGIDGTFTVELGLLLHKEGAEEEEEEEDDADTEEDDAQIEDGSTGSSDM
jgi:hypothetical protein